MVGTLNNRVNQLHIIKHRYSINSYAYNIFFNTGCRSGIYTFEHLRELGEEVA